MRTRLNWHDALVLLRKKRVPEMHQMNMSECGATCLAMILMYYGHKTTVAEVRQRCGPGRDGLSALSLVKAARTYGLRVRALSVEIGDFRYLQLPAIVHWEFKHFLVVEHWFPKYVDVVDPADGRRRLSAEEFGQSFTGIVLLLEPGVHFSRQRKSSQYSLWSYLRSVLRLPGFVVQILGASLFLQMLGLILPLFTKIVVDQVIPASLEQVMPLLGLGMLVIVLIQVITALLRAWLLVYLQARVDMQMMLGFFEHLLTLPYRFFLQRSSGDMLARLNSNSFIRQTLTNQMISTLLDGGTVIVYLLILIRLSPLLAVSALAIGSLQILILLLSSHLIHSLTKRDLIAQGEAQGYLTEALISIATIKAAGAEEQIFQRWANLFFEHLNLYARRDAFASVVSTLLGGLSSLAPLLLLWVGTIQVLQGAMSIGTMLALNALAAGFLGPLSSLTTSGQQLQQVRAHFERLIDVVTAEPEQDLQVAQLPPPFTGLVELQQVSFRYHANAPLVLHDITLCIQPGQKVALVGRTGSGKSTLGKLLLGLHLPEEGEILYDQLPLSSFNYRAVRKQFGVVLQESALFNGSIRENITLNNPEMTLEQVMNAARAAAIHEEIMHMPMGYETTIAEGGHALSGGQCQRIAIARALASRPAILLLDEATSHLDVLTERVVEQNLNALECTRIVIAHRLSTIRNAELILVLDEGKIVERGTHQELFAQEGYYAALVRSQFSSEEQQTAL